jgi:hypothetical protein
MTHASNETRTRARLVLYKFIWTALSLGLTACADYLIGFVNHTRQIRETSRLFREEVAPLQIHTLNLIPNLNHLYTDPERPPTERLVQEGAVRILQTDSAGLIRSVNRNEVEYKQESSSSTKTILFLGGSTTECNEVDEPFRFPAVVEKLLRTAGANVQVQNGGVRGHTTQDSINALLNREGFRNADIIVLMQNINDRARLAAGLDYTVHLGNVAPTTTSAVETSFRELCANIWDWISYRSNLIFIVRMAASRLDPWTGKRTIVIDNRSINFNDPQIESHLTEFELRIRIFTSIVKTLGKTPVLMTQPLGIDSEGEKRYNAVIRNVAVIEGVPLIDLEAGFGIRPRWAFLHDNIHLNNIGSVAAGGIISCELAKTLVNTRKAINVGVLFSGQAPSLTIAVDKNQNGRCYPILNVSSKGTTNLGP